MGTCCSLGVCHWERNEQYLLTWSCLDAMGTACSRKQFSPQSWNILAIQSVLNTLVLYCLKLTREDVFCWRCPSLVVRRWLEDWHSWWTCCSCVMLQQNLWSATLFMCLFSGATQLEYYVASNKAWCNSDWNNTHACMSQYMWHKFFKLKQTCSLFEELSQATAFILPSGNTGSEELRESRLNLDPSQKAVTSEVNYL